MQVYHSKAIWIALLCTSSDGSALMIALLVSRSILYRGYHSKAIRIAPDRSARGKLPIDLLGIAIVIALPG